MTNVCGTLRTLIENDEQHCPTCYQEVEREVVQQIIDEKENEKSQRCTELDTLTQSLKTETENLESRHALEQRLQTLQGRFVRFEQYSGEIAEIQSELSMLASRLAERGIQKGEELPSETAVGFDKPRLKAQIDRERKRLDQLKQQEAVRLDRLRALQRTNRDAAKVEKTLLSLELACAGVDKNH